jgi:hypothetical protein
MSIALTEEHQELARVARSFLDARRTRAESRARLEAQSDQLPAFWKEMSRSGRASATFAACVHRPVARRHSFVVGLKRLPMRYRIKPAA